MKVLNQQDLLQQNYKIRTNKDITGKKYGKLTALNYDSHRQGTGHILIYWRFRCECGNEVVRIKSSVMCGNTSTCGCFERSLDDLRAKRVEKWKWLTSIDKSNFTNRQLQVAELLIKGYSQIEISLSLHLHQSTINKIINGSWRAEHSKFHGGIKNKIRKQDDNLSKIERTKSKV